MEDTKFHTDEFYTLKAEVRALDRLIEIRYNELLKYFESKLEAIELATQRALQSNEKRLEGMNEFREALKDQASRFLYKDEFLAQYELVRKDLKNLELAKAELTGKASTEDMKKNERKATTAMFIGAMSVLVAIIALIVTVIYKG